MRFEKGLEGIVHTDINASVKVSVEGAGNLWSLGSADPASTENFYDEKRTLYYGKALAIVRAGMENGEMRVKVETEGCEPVYCKLYVRK